MKKRLLIIAGGVVGQTGDSYVTKKPIADYLHEISENFSSCTWVANYSADNSFEEVIDDKLVNLVIVRPGKFNRIYAWIYTSCLALQHDYLIYFLPNPFLPVLPLLRLCSKKFVVYLAGDYEASIEWYKDQRWFGWAVLFRWSFELPMRVCDTVIARGRRLAQNASRFNNKVIETIPMGHIETANFEKFSYPSLVAKKKVLFIGKMISGKGVFVLLDAFKMLVDDISDFHIQLDFVGDGQDLSALRDKAIYYEICDRVNFHGWVSSTDNLNAIFCDTDVLVVPSIYPEGVPRVIDEAIVREIPVISTSVGGIGSEFVYNEILLVEENSPVILFHAMKKLLFDEAFRTSQLKHATSRSNFIKSYGSAARQHLSVLLD